MQKQNGILMKTTLSIVSILLGLDIISPLRAFTTTVTKQPSPTIWAKGIEELRQRGDVPGMSIAVIRDGKIFWEHSFGRKNAIPEAKTDGPVRDDTLFPAASLSKPVFAYIALRLVDRGILDLDKPLYEYLPSKRMESDERYKRITARMILSHTSGLPNWGGTPLNLLFTPGERWNYSSEGFMYLQAVVEKLSGESLETLAQEEVFRPLNMKHSTYAWAPALAGNLVSGDSGVIKPQVINDPNAGAAYSLLTTSEDYARFVLAILNGIGLKKKTLDQMLTPLVETHQDQQAGKQKTPPSAFWGLGWGLEKKGQEYYFWHVGDIGGFKCFVIGSREKREGLVAFTNTLDGFSIIDPLVTLVLHEKHSLMDWAGFTQVRYNAPGIIARKDLIRAFNEHGDEIGWAHYKSLRKKAPDIIDESVTNELAYYLRNHGKMDAAIAIFKENVRNYPRSMNTYDSLLVTYLFADKVDLAIETLDQSIKWEPDSKQRQERISWLRDYVHAQKIPVSVPLETLQRYTGDFKDRKVTLKDGSLYCEEAGSGASHRLIPLSDDTFAMEGEAWVHLRFTTDERDKTNQIVVLNWP
jgi:CubicO group peptidase (beta-lactamase class C family)